MADKFEKELLDVDLSGINVRTAPKHPRSVELIKTISEMLMTIGVPFKFSDHADFFLYTFSQFKNDDLCIAFIFWITYTFHLDDHLDRNPEDFSKWYNILEGEECVGDGKMEKLYQLFLKAADKAFINPKSFIEVLRLTKEWLENYEKLQLLRSGEISDQELIEARILDVGALPCLYFVQADAELQVTNELASDENWNKLRYNAIVQLIIINDLFSVKKEVRDGQGKSNYVYVKMKNNNLSAQEAVRQLSIEADNAEQMARYHGQKLKESYDIEGLHTYVDGLFTAMIGNLYWSASCKRYKI